MPDRNPDTDWLARYTEWCRVQSINRENRAAQARDVIRARRVQPRSNFAEYLETDQISTTDDGSDEVGD
jgi:hypothetical protein